MTVYVVKALKTNTYYTTVTIEKTTPTFRLAEMFKQRECAERVAERIPNSLVIEAVIR